MRQGVTYIFIFLSILFVVYSFSIYLKPLFDTDHPSINKEEAANGQLVWQKYNCQACHQLYGLGGFLGPDLTNVLSNPYKGEEYVRAFIQSGTKQMPVFTIPDEEMSALIAFLKSTDASGIADPRNFSTNHFGMIQENEKKK